MRFSVVSRLCAGFILCLSWVLPLHAQEARGPIAAVGHGAFLDAAGRQIVPTERFVTDAIAWYRNDAAARVPPEKRALIDRQLEEARRARVLGTNQRLLLELRAAERLYASATVLPTDARSVRALGALAYLLRFQLPQSSSDRFGAYARPADLGADFDAFLQRFGLAGGGGASAQSVTTNSGLAYINECRSHGVPIPPPIGDVQWVSRGFIPTNKLFLINSSVEVLTYTSTTPQGLCIALPRSNDTNPADGITVTLDGVICLGKAPSPISGKSTACFWDNQMNGQSFPFLKGTKIPIGWNDPAQVSPNPSGRFMSGGAQLTNPGAGMCSDCHAGQNPYIVHPATVLGTLGQPPLNLPMFGDTWYDPLVLASWPQNQKRLNDAYVPSDCRSCHLSGGSGGQFPHVSTSLPEYCTAVLNNAVRGSVTPGGAVIQPTMPPNSPGSAANAADVKVISALPGTMPAPFCNIGPTAGPANRGDPHIVTTNAIAYDFQAAGEFIALTDGDGSFELQTRQSPVLTTFVPGANAYTGLASCVSLNTAVALRMGGKRVTYQPMAVGERRVMQLRIDGRIRPIDRGTIDLGNRNVITPGTGGSLTFAMRDGTRVIATPRYWESQGYWYLDIEVLGTTARAGIMGHIAGGEWLPRGGDGTNFGPMPAALADRAVVLNRKFADTWRVTERTSLFDYAAGESPKSFVDLDWSLSTNCRRSTLPAPLVREPASLEAAKLACRSIADRTAREQCTFDSQVMNDLTIVKAYLRTLEQRAAAQAAAN